MSTVRIEPNGGGALPGAGQAQRAGQPQGPARAQRQPADSGDEAELRKVTQEFESFLLQQLLKQARASARLLGGDTQPEMPGRDIFESWQDESYAQAVSGAGGIGLADMLVRQLQPQGPIVPRPDANAAPDTNAAQTPAADTSTAPDAAHHAPTPTPPIEPRKEE